MLLLKRIESAASGLFSQIERVAARPAGRWVLATILFVAAAGMRMTYLDADPPAHALTWSGAFATDEGVWSFLAAEWSEGRGPSPTREHAVGSLAFPYTLTQYLTFRTFGVDLTTVRLANSLLGSLLPALILLRGRHTFGSTSAFLAGVLVATNYWLAMYQRTAMTDGWMMIWVTFAFLSWERLAASPTPRRALTTGILTGVAVWSKISAVAFLAAVSLSGLFQFLKSRHRPKLLRLATLFAAGLLMVGCCAIVVYGFWWPELGELAGGRLSMRLQVSAPPPPDWLISRQWIVRNSPPHRFMPFVTLGAYGCLIGMAAAFLRRRRITGSCCAFFWIPVFFTMLIPISYLPPRYYLQLVPPLVALFLYSLSWLWKSPVKGPAIRTLLRAGVVVVFAAEVSLSLWRFGAWVGDRDYSQRDVGRAIAGVLGADRESARVAGQAAFNLALAGGFRPMGWKLAVDEAAARGATHYLSTGAVRPEEIERARRSGVGVELIETYSYYRNYFSQQQDLHFYRLRPEASGEPGRGLLGLGGGREARIDGLAVRYEPVANSNRLVARWGWAEKLRRRRRCSGRYGQGVPAP